MTPQEAIDKTAHLVYFRERGQETLATLQREIGARNYEKGNTNRLLMVATIYRNLDQPYENFLLVRASEDQNNHYFRTLRDSGVWTALCGRDAYAKMTEFTGFDLGSWVARNIDWTGDLDPQTLEHFQLQNLVGYLEW